MSFLYRSKDTSLLMLLVWCLLFPLSAVASENHHDTHGHDTHGHDTHADNFEWAGIFTTEQDSYNWIAQKAESGSYVEPHMKMAVLAAGSSTFFELSALRTKANAALGASTFTNVTSGQTIQVSDHQYSILTFDVDFYQTMYKMNLTGVPHVAIFTEHFPTEFEADTHFFKDEEGSDIEASFTIPIAGASQSSENTSRTQWSKALGGASLVWIVTLAGVVIMSKSARDHYQRQDSVVYVFMYATSAGVLLATAVYLVLIESSHLIGEGYTKEVDTTWRWGTMVLAGFLTPFATTIFAMLIGGKSFKGHLSKDESMTDIETSHADIGQKGAIQKKIDFRLILAIIVADGMHAFVDGIMIGTAFKFCDNKLAWSVTLSTVLHELLQEISDFFLLTAQGGLSSVTALGCNFISGFGVMIGAIVMMANGMIQHFISVLSPVTPTFNV